MSQFWLYFNHGLQHVLNWNTYEHALLIVVLVAAFGFSDWKQIARLVSLFTAGYLISMALASFQVVIVKKELVEFLTPMTVLLTAFYSLSTAGKARRKGKFTLLFVASLFFGLLHGLAFSDHFRKISTNVSEQILPLLEFALGTAAAIIIVILAVLILGTLVQYIFRFSKRDWVLIISSIAIGLAIPLLTKNIFW